MREIAFVVAEYNPFHNGHRYHLQETKKAGARHVICIMSGNFVQRGDIALCDKHLRARFAVENGADLVLELPLPYVLSGASCFAEGAAKVVAACNLFSTVSFGASVNISELKDLREILDSTQTVSLAKKISAECGSTYPSALYQAVLYLFGEHQSLLLKDPNNVLALEYMSQMRKYCHGTDFFAVPRIAVVHDANIPARDFAAAKYIRSCFYQSDFMRISDFIPENVMRLLKENLSAGMLPADRNKFSVAAISRLSGISAAQLRAVNGVSQGLENRIERKIKETNDLYALFDAVKTKRYTHARIRQALVSAVLGIKRSDAEELLPYVRVLALNNDGRHLLREIKTHADIPFIMNISEAPDCRLQKLDCDAGKLFEMCRPVPRNINAEYAEKPFVLSE